MELQAKWLERGQPYTYDLAYSKRMMSFTMEAKMLLAKKMLTRGLKDTNKERVVFIARINFGLTSILAQLNAKGDFRSVVSE